MPQHITVVEYSPQWPLKYEREKEKIMAILKESMPFQQIFLKLGMSISESLEYPAGVIFARAVMNERIRYIFFRWRIPAISDGILRFGIICALTKKNAKNMKS